MTGTQPRGFDQNRAIAALQSQRNHALDTVAMQEGHIATLEERVAQQAVILGELQKENETLRAKVDALSAPKDAPLPAPNGQARRSDMNSAAN